MSIDRLQEKIRKTKCAIILDLSWEPALIPESLEPELYITGLLKKLQGIIPAVRLNFDQFALEGGLQWLSEVATMAQKLGYYVLVDGPAVLSPWAAQRAAGILKDFPFDGMVLSPYIGEDAVRPFLPLCKDEDKSVFYAVRTPNKTAAQIQDLMTGTRLVHLAAAELVTRQTEGLVGKSGYGPMGLLTSGVQTATVKSLRAKYPRAFLLVDGYDYPGGNAKNCSLGFDKLGHGSAMSVGPAILGAWQQSQEDPLEAALQAVQRIRGNQKNYVTIL